MPLSKDKLKSFYRKLQQDRPLLAYLLWRLYQKRPINTVKYIVNGTGNTFRYNRSILSSVKFHVLGNRNTIHIKPGCILRNVTFFIKGDDHHIDIGENCQFRRGSLIWFEDSKCRLTVGESTTFEDAHLALTEPGSEIRIGRDCMFAYDIDVRTGDSHALIDAASGKKINPAKNVVIGDHVWIAAHSLILKGVSIAENSVVATGSVVTRSCMEKGVVLAGNPAKVTKQGVTWSRKRFVDP